MRNVKVTRCSFTRTNKHIKADNEWEEGVAFCCGDILLGITDMNGVSVNTVHWSDFPYQGCFVTCVEDV